MAEFNFTTLGTAITVLDSQLNSLATETGVVPATTQDNTDGDFYSDWALTLSTVDLSSIPSPAVYVYLLSSIDGGTTYEKGSSSIEPARRPDIIFSLRESNDNFFAMERLILTPHDFKPLLVNHMGAALASSGNSLAYAEYSTESN